MINNQCQFLGRLGQDISVKTFDSGDKVGNVSMAVDDSYKDRDGNKVERTRWVNLVFRNKICNVIEQYAPKGTQILVQCKYAPRKYQVDNEDRWSHEFVVTNMQLLGSKNESPREERRSPEPSPAPSPAPMPDDPDDDLPF